MNRVITVAYDVTSLAENPFGGIAQVCHHTLEQAVNDAQVRPTAICRNGNPQNIEVSGITVRRVNPLDRFRFFKYDIVHALGHRIPPSRYRRLVYTLHDAWSLYPNRYQSPDFQRKIGARMKADLCRTDAIVCVSRATRDKLSELGLVDPERCHVVTNGVAEPGRPAPKAEDPVIAELLAKDFALFVGRVEVRKNLEHVVEAVLPLQNLHLIVVGEFGYRGRDIAGHSLCRLPIDRLHTFSQVRSSDLDLLYRRAVATLQPSWEEGFGLPVLEAMARGCPVVTSNCSATAEVAGESAILVDPAEPSQSRTALERLVADSQYRKEIAERGLTRSREFTWEKYFEKLAKLYHDLLSQ